MSNVEVFTHHQPFGGSDPAHTATAPGKLDADTPALTPLMLDPGTAADGDTAAVPGTGVLVAWDGADAGTAIGILVLPTAAGSSELTFYKSGTFRLEDIQWPKAVTDENIKRNAFAGTALSVV